MAAPWGVTTCSALRPEKDEVARWAAFVRAGHCTRMALPGGRTLHRIARRGGEVVVATEPLSTILREALSRLRVPDLRGSPLERWDLGGAAVWVPGRAGHASVTLSGVETRVGQLGDLSARLPADDPIAEALRAAARLCLRHDLVLWVRPR